MTSKPILFFILSFSVIACAKNRPISLDIQCDNDIKLATKHLKASTDELDKDIRKKIDNLVRAAKIQQQHAEYPSCIDKAQRALTLLKADEQSKDSK